MALQKKAYGTGTKRDDLNNSKEVSRQYPLKAILFEVYRTRKSFHKKISRKKSVHFFYSFFFMSDEFFISARKKREKKKLFPSPNFLLGLTKVFSSSHNQKKI